VVYLSTGRVTEEALVTPAMPSVSMSLDKIAGSGSRPGSYHRALLAAYQRAPNASYDASDNGPAPSTVVVSAPLCEAFTDESSDEQDDPQEDGYDAFV
jgi:hypothetical protein